MNETQLKKLFFTERIEKIPFPRWVLLIGRIVFTVLLFAVCAAGFTQQGWLNAMVWAVPLATLFYQAFNGQNLFRHNQGVLRIIAYSAIGMFIAFTYTYVFGLLLGWIVR